MQDISEEIIKARDLVRSIEIMMSNPITTTSTPPSIG